MSYVCANCLQENTIYEAVTLHGCSMKVEVVSSEDGPLAVETDRQRRVVSWDSVDGEGFFCTNCEASGTKLEAVVIECPVLECRACGFRGGDPTKHRDCQEPLERLGPTAVNPRQETLT